MNIIKEVLQGHGWLLYSDTTLTALDESLHAFIIIVIGVFFYPQWSIIVLNVKRCLPLILRIIRFGFIVDAITVLFYGVFHTIGVTWFSPVVGLCITTVALGALSFFPAHRTRDFLSNGDALFIGCVQGCALLPGISRFGTTFSALRLLGISSARAFALSFLIEMPLSCAAALKGFRMLALGDSLYLITQQGFCICLASCSA
jgi:undecaprenyl pyrophosphate phosphatase UppP